MANWRTIADIRRDYGDLTLDEKYVSADPFIQFELWFEDVLVSETSDPTAMVLSTVDRRGRPDSRVVLLKGIEQDSFVFYTNYDSNKGIQLRHIPYAALNFYWPQIARQVRARGRVKRTTKAQSDRYFLSRPIISQLSALASPQSRLIADRQSLENTLNKLLSQHEQTSQKPIIRPKNWGGYCVVPDNIEFWQGRDNRLHDRLHYFKKKGAWVFQRLAP